MEWFLYDRGLRHEIDKLTSAYLPSSFSTWPKSHDKNVNILGLETAFNME